MKKNIYKNARLAAAKTEPDLSTVEKAHPHLYISREKLMMIEQTNPKKRQASPSPDEVVLMSKVYKAPELCNYYCTHQCPIGKENKPLIHDNLGEIASGLMSALYFLDSFSEKIHEILADSKISDEERQSFEKSLEILNNISYSTDCLDLWARKHGLWAQSKDAADT